MNNVSRYRCVSRHSLRLFQKILSPTSMADISPMTTSSSLQPSINHQAPFSSGWTTAIDCYTMEATTRDEAKGNKFSTLARHRAGCRDDGGQIYELVFFIFLPLLFWFEVNKSRFSFQATLILLARMMSVTSRFYRLKLAALITHELAGTCAVSRWLLAVSRWLLLKVRRLKVMVLNMHKHNIMLKGWRWSSVSQNVNVEKRANKETVGVLQGRAS